MDLLLEHSTAQSGKTISISGSKSETNRMLLLQALYPEISLENISHSDDSEAMLNALNNNHEIVDIHHAGTAMRFLTGYFATQEGRTVTLTGSPRMQQRPVKILVEALQQLGAEITYANKVGFPPLKITGKKLTQNKVTLKADVSSQYISALLLIAAKLENGLELTLEGEITSMPYIRMTLALLNEIGVRTTFEGNKITVFPQFSIPNSQLLIESDWSSASYFYSVIALSNVGTQITLSTFKKASFQGDSALSNIYKDFGVETIFEDNSITLTKTVNCPLSIFNFHLNDTPDIAQTIAVTCFGLGIGCELSGLHTLKIKETDRLEALKVELRKLGADISVTDDSLSLKPSKEINPNITIKTYDDHRMAMAFAPLALQVPIFIENAEVVSKSYPNFWKDLKTLGFQISERI
jgi:3-phosphoshikimate 1-carboxyvinyltransferase